MRKWIRFIAVALLISMLSPVAGLAEDEIRGYDKAAGYVYVAFGSYPQDADGGVAPIAWRVLTVEDGKAYLLTEYVLQAMRVHRDKKYPGWRECDIFAFLNGDFLNNTFTEEERAAIVVDDEIGTITFASADDLKNADFGFPNAASRQAQSTEYAKTTGLYDYRGKMRYAPYWTRTPSDKNYAQRRTMKDGKIGYIAVEVSDLGIRPACWVDLSLVTITSGTGTLNDPFVLSGL